MAAFFLLRVLLLLAGLIQLDVNSGVVAAQNEGKVRECESPDYAGTRRVISESLRIDFDGLSGTIELLHRVVILKKIIERSSEFLSPMIN